MATADGDIDPDRFTTASTAVRGFRQVFTHEGPTDGPRPLALLVHGWPETRRIWWRCIAPLAAAGFEVVAPDLRGFGDSDVGPDGFHDVPAHSRDLESLLADLGCPVSTVDRPVVLVGGDLGGPIIQDLSLRRPDLVDRMVLFNSPLPYDKVAMAGLDSRPAVEAADYFLRQGTDPDGLLADLPTEGARRRYIATFYTSRFWAHPGAFTPEAVAFFTEPFGDAAHLRASFGGYESVFSAAAQSALPALRTPNPTKAMLLFGPSDHVIYPAFDQMAAVVFPDRVGPFLLRDCGHFVQWEAADRLVSGTIAFCGDLLERASAAATRA